MSFLSLRDSASSSSTVRLARGSDIRAKKRTTISVLHNSTIGTPSSLLYAIVGGVTTAKTRKSQKVGRKKETRVIREQTPDDPGRLVITGLKAEFDAAHVQGMAALKRHDYATFTKAIRRERKVIDSVSAAIQRRKRGKP
jgi:hypothetical protein